RFDYSGHGDSSGEINNLLLSNWVEESKILIKIKTKYPLILIGSSMGAWIALFLSFLIKRKIKGIIGIASAVDFTSIMLKKLNKSQYQKFLNLKKLKVESDYSKTPYFFSKKFIDDSKKFLLLKKNISIKPRTTLLYGMKDSSVDLMSQIKLLENLSDVRSTLLILKKSDHRMSSINDLKIIKKSLLEYVRNS
ncbi:MAG: alpha/beta hydrolase, partial [Pseudomonadota bacterium]|nr:alpha/beta hydrolase [Pseudomonadota bacterium]